MMKRLTVGLLVAAWATAACAQGEFKAADAELNRLYKQIETRLAGETDKAHLLTAAQRAWVTFRDAECTFAVSSVAGGSAYGEVVAACKTDLTTKRVADFKTYLNCEEGDLACPVPGN